MNRHFRPAEEMQNIYLYRDPVDFRKSYRGLAAIVEQELGHNIFEGGLYAFTNRIFSDKLPRVQIHLRLSDEEKAGASNTFFTKVKEKLDIIPAQARVLEYWQEKALFKEDGGAESVKVADRLVHPLGKCRQRIYCPCC